MLELQETINMEHLFPGGSEMAEYMRSLDWSMINLPLPIEWPEELGVSVSLCLMSSMPTIIFWGPSHIMFYNDAYSSLLGEKYSYYLGKSCSECWPEMQSLLDSVHQNIYENHQGIWSEDMQYFVTRKLPLEEVHFRVSYSPIMDRYRKTINGIIGVGTETTEKILSVRRLKTLRKLSLQVVDPTKNIKKACEQAMKVLGENSEDLSFAAIYMVDDSRKKVRLMASVGLKEYSIFQELALISDNSVVGYSHPFSSPLVSVFNNRCSEILSDLCSIGLNLPGGIWPEYSNQAVILPIRSPTQDADPIGILILGVSPRLVFDDVYYSFFELITAHVGTLISNARLNEIECAHGGEESSSIEEMQTDTDNYLVNPCETKELIARIRTQLELSRPNKSLMAKLNIMTQLHAIATQFVQEGDVYNILLEALDAAISITHASKGVIQITDEEGKKLKLIAARGFSKSFIENFEICFSGRGTCGTALQMGERVMVEDITNNPIFIDAPNLMQLILDEGVRAIQATPLKNRSGKILGMLSTHYPTPHVPDFKDLQMLDLIACLTAEILESGYWIRERTKWVEMLREADRRKDNFLAMLSHELRNPLAAISNSSFMLSRVPVGSDRALRAQATIERQLQQINRLVDDLLDVTRITQNKIQLRRQRLDMNELVYRTLEDHRAMFESLEIKLQAKLSAEPVMINADPTRISQVISNLLQNAAKFSLPGGLTQVAVSMEDSEVVIQVIDDGIGIESKLIEHLFEPFMQADSSLDRSQGGLGLGLALVKGLVELHGGRVNVSSGGEGNGAKFTVRLPLDNLNNDVNTSKSEKTKPSTIHNVLIIDDNIHAADSLSMVIETFGHTTHVAYNSADGIRKAEEIKPDFILCDIGLPNMNGYQVAEILKANENLSSTYLIALSGYAQPEDIEKSHAAGFHIHLAKPPNLVKLEQILLDAPPIDLLD